MHCLKLSHAVEVEQGISLSVGVASVASPLDVPRGSYWLRPIAVSMARALRRRRGEEQRYIRTRLHSRECLFHRGVPLALPVLRNAKANFRPAATM